MNKDLKILVDRLERAFPHLVLWEDGHYCDGEEGYYPPFKFDWYKFLETLNQNGLTIANIKDVKNPININKNEPRENT